MKLFPSSGSVVGDIFIYQSLESIPADRLILNGATFDQDLYPELYKHLGNSNVLPDWRGYFPRMSDLGRGIDSGRQVGTFQADSFKSHGHKARRPDNTFRYVMAGGNKIMGGNFQPDETGVLFTPESSSFEGGSETRPKNVAVIFAIKAE